VFNGYESACTTFVVIGTFLRCYCLLDKPTRDQHRLVNARTSHLTNNEFLNHGNTTTIGTNSNKNYKAP